MTVPQWARLSKATRHALPGYRPAVESLEDRLALSIDIGNLSVGVCTGMYIDGSPVIDCRLLAVRPGEATLGLRTNYGLYKILADVSDNQYAAQAGPELTVSHDAGDNRNGPVAGIAFTFHIQALTSDRAPQAVIHEASANHYTVFIGAGEFVLPLDDAEGYAAKAASAVADVPRQLAIAAIDSGDPSAIRQLFVAALDDWHRYQDERTMEMPSPDSPQVDVAALAKHQSDSAGTGEPGTGPAASEEGREETIAPQHNLAATFVAVAPCDWRDPPTVRKLGCPYEGHSPTGAMDVPTSPDPASLTSWLALPAGEEDSPGLPSTDPADGTRVPPAALTAFSGREQGVVAALLSVPKSPSKPTAFMPHDTNQVPPGIVIGLDAVPRELPPSALPSIEADKRPRPAPDSALFPANELSAGVLRFVDALSRLDTRVDGLPASPAAPPPLPPTTTPCPSDGSRPQGEEARWPGIAELEHLLDLFFAADR